ncbi:hypothetical protein K505DRAFT_84667 [Melanomma pulvis-pyrius CBS 109.77]|uniref:Uncharacterized protein n=1 Tax=Melanomma pulvis-pyrius CBS 109.77 TaxID=1314802 RepID=A0A6A6X1K6_9PLEO|nr:hypothetical protein K505DRAFT_84667 [Melanomma pulvis-pyrius CBS 109.77]
MHAREDAALHMHTHHHCTNSILLSCVCCELQALKLFTPYLYALLFVVDCRAMQDTSRQHYFSGGAGVWRYPLFVPFIVCTFLRPEGKNKRPLFWSLMCWRVSVVCDAWRGGGDLYPHEAGRHSSMLSVIIHPPVSFGRRRLQRARVIACHYGSGSDRALYLLR